MVVAQFLEIQRKPPRHFRPNMAKSKTPVSVGSEGLPFAASAEVTSLKI